MKFTGLQIGQRFRYQGKTYRKATPLTATAEGEEQKKLIPRSALVEALDARPDPVPTSAARDIPVATLDRAMNELASDINEIIAESGLNAEQASSLSRQLQAAFLKTRHHLNLL